MDEEDDGMTLGEKILQARKDNGWSQAKLAELVDVKQQAVFRWERGITTPTLKTLRRIAYVTDVPFEELCSDSFSNDSAAESKPAAGQEQAAANFNEYLRKYIIDCVIALDDRKALLEIASDVERVLSALAKKEAEAE